MAEKGGSKTVDWVHCTNCDGASFMKVASGNDLVAYRCKRCRRMIRVAVEQELEYERSGPPRPRS